ncbi:efflux RND transporter periplasmic adaptor subunit [Desulfitobacterium metallireducens]|uniref:RND transporter n=1 Tax=Desulfitobacterium metallireducens DSM 15288 TaxID=871968 RepID=W0EFP9_9FIRM|nr:efflux RND transporter periplasmic adaptor subunit [Desulfitobacterium metallireducens]AHF07901.1 RND transporter [Desulfitobacterium metallireducens DSM 15288]
MSRKKWAWSIVSVAILLGVIFSAWWFVRTPAGVKVKVAAVENTSIQQEVYASGTVAPVQQQQVALMAPSKVAKVYVHTGDTVKSGQTLVQMDTTLADAQVAQAKAGVNTAQTNLSVAQKNLDSIKGVQVASVMSQIASSGTPPVLQNSSSIPTVEVPMNSTVSASDNPIQQGSDSALQQAEAAVSQAQAMLQQAQEGLKVAQAQRAQNVYVASIAGTVLELNAQDESMAPLQTPLVVVGDLSKLQVSTQLNEVDAGKVQLGQKVRVTSKVLGTTPIAGAISEVAPQAVSKVSVQGNTPPSVGVKIDLDNVPPELKPGFTVDLNIATASKDNILAIPQEALFQEGGKSFVFQVVNKILKKTEVSLGIANDTLQEITSGLKAGDLVVINPTAELANGLPVTLDMGSGTP